MLFRSEMDQDLKVDAFNIKEVQLRLPATKHKWAGRFIRHKLELAALQKSREIKTKELATKVMNLSPVKISEYTAEKSIQNTDSLKEIDEKINEIKLIIELLEKSEKTFSSMTWDIKNCIDLMKAETM